MERRGSRVQPGGRATGRCGIDPGPPTFSWDPLRARLAGVEEGADFLAPNDGGDVAALFEVEDEDGEFSFTAHGERGHVHDFEFAGHGFGEGDVVEAGGSWVFLGVGGVDTIDFGGFEEHFAFEFGGAEGGAGIGREVGVSGASGQDDDAAFFHMAHGAVADEGLGDCFDFNRGHDAAVDPEGNELFFEGEGVHDGAQHAHLVGGGLVDVAACGELCAADDVATTHDDGDSSPLARGGFQFVADDFEFFNVDSETAGTAECFTGEFEQDAGEALGTSGRGGRGSGSGRGWEGVGGHGESSVKEAWRAEATNPDGGRI